MSEGEYLLKAGMLRSKAKGCDTGEAAERCEGMKIWRRRRADATELDEESERASRGECLEQGLRPRPRS